MDRQVYERMDANEAGHWWFVGRRRIIETAIQRLIPLPENADILEAGCGTGGNLALLSRFGALDAFEYDPIAREISAKKSGLVVSAGALPDDIPFDQKCYDMVGLFDVLEHIEDDQATLTQLAARLKPNGRVLLTVPAMPWLWSRHDERHHHFRRYTRKSIQEAADKAGILVEKSFYFNTLLLPLAIGSRALKAVTNSASADDSMPSPWVNQVLTATFSSERHLAGRLPMPAGLSLCAVLKPETSTQ